MIALRLQSSDSTTASALSAAVSRQGWCEALSTALGSGYRVVWRDAGDVARVTLTMSGSLPISEQQVTISAQPSAVSCSAGTPTHVQLESADGSRWARLDRLVALVDSTGAPLAPVSGAGFRWVDPLVVQPPVQLSALPAWLQDASLLTWHEIPNTALNTAENRAAFGLNSTEARYVCAYSGAAWNGATMYVQGGGHENYTRGGTYGIDLSQDAPAWFEVGPARAVGTTDQITFHGTEYQGYYSPYDGNPDDRQNRFPVESHTYWNIWYDAATNRIYRVNTGGAGAVNYELYGGIPGGSSNVNALDISTGRWDGKGGARQPAHYRF